MTETIMLVGAGVMGRGYVDAARAMGLRIVLLDDPERRTTYEDLVDHFVEPGGRTEAHWLGAALQAAGDHWPHGIVSFNEPHVLAAAWVQTRGQLPGPSLMAADASRNKAMQRILFGHAGLTQPEFGVVATVDDAIAWSRGRYPVVVKPLRGMGSAGVRSVADEPALLADLAQRDVEQQLLVEEYIDAPEYSWEALVQDGEVKFGNYTRKVTSGPREFVELQHQLPWRGGLDTERLDREMAAAVAAVGVRSSLVHLEFRDDGSTMHPMEIAVRTPGDNIMELLNVAYDHDFFRSVLELSLSRPVGTPTAALRSAGIVYVTAPGPGRLEAVHGLDKAAARSDVLRVGQRKALGDDIAGLHSSGDRVAHVVLSIAGEADLASAMDEVRRMIDVRVVAPEQVFATTSDEAP